MEKCFCMQEISLGTAILCRLGHRQELKGWGSSQAAFHALYAKDLWLGRMIFYCSFNCSIVLPLVYLALRKRGMGNRPTHPTTNTPLFHMVHTSFKSSRPTCSQNLAPSVKSTHPTMKINDRK